MRLKDRLFDLYRHGTKNTLAYVDTVECLLVEFVDALEQSLAESTLVRAAVAGMLAIDKGEIGLAVAGRVGESKFEVLRFIITRLVSSAVAHLAPEQV